MGSIIPCHARPLVYSYKVGFISMSLMEGRRVGETRTHELMASRTATKDKRAFPSATGPQLEEPRVANVAQRGVSWQGRQGE